MQYKNTENIWENVFHDAVFLCDTNNTKQDASILGIVRDILGIPEGCPVVSVVSNHVSYALFSLFDLIIPDIHSCPL